MMTGRQHRSRPPWTLQYTILFMAVLFAASGCALLRQREKVVIKTETVTEYRDSTVWRDTTIFVPIPLESDQAIVHVGDTSHRETSVAESDAWVGSDGFLHHNLRNKPVSLAQGVKLPDHFLVTDVKNTMEQAHVITREVQVEKKLNFWQRFRIGAFWWLLGLIAFAYRKQIMAILAKAFGHY